ncbi:MAG: L-histidine N(alpha)-methyltransferase [Chloroflexi bacterium]|nr:L-histidine N(alpha)-methyltransferase [Chloroflexota bacterium]
MADDVRRGLTAPQKSLPCKYFYDAYGSRLFERITEIPEYYQTRTELATLQSIADPFVDDGRFTELVELGSGSATKTRTLLDAMERRGCLTSYIPVDVSEAMLRESAAALLDRYRNVTVHGVVGDFQQHLGSVPRPTGPRLVIFLGSTIGNLQSDERRHFLAEARELLDADDRFLIGVDLVKDVGMLEAAYNDSAGITAEFNRNILRVVNRELGATFVPEAYRHSAYYNEADRRIEMHLVPEDVQRVYVRDLQLTIDVSPRETIWTEISCKFTWDSVVAMLDEAGMTLTQWHTDPRGLFGLALAARHG